MFGVDQEEKRKGRYKATWMEYINGIRTSIVLKNADWEELRIEEENKFILKIVHI